MATTAVTGKGTTLTNSTTFGGTYTAVAEVFNVTLPSSNAPIVDATHYASGSYGDSISTGFLEAGEATFEVNVTKAQQTILLGLAGDAMFWKVLIPAIGTYSFPGVLSLGSGTVPVKDRVTMGGTIRVTGDMTFVEAV